MLLLGLVLSGLFQCLRWLRKLTGWRRQTRVAPKVALLPTGEVDLEPEYLPEWQVLWQLAQTQSDPGQAQRTAYLALLAYLDFAGHIRYRPGCTNREYLAQLTDQPELRRTFQGLTRHFDRCRYGAGQPDFANFQVGCQQIFPA